MTFSPGKKPKAASSQAFIDAARELECDESEGRFNTVLRQVAKHKPKLDEAKAEKDKPGQ